MTPSPLDNAAHIVQLALTPVFLLSGVAALLNVFATRLGRISDQVDKLVADPGDKAPEVRIKLHYLRIRSRLLDVAVVLAALAGACTCGAALVLFLGAVRDASAGNALFLLFGGAIVLTTGALTAFVLEVLLAGIGVRRLGIEAPGNEARRRKYRRAASLRTASEPVADANRGGLDV